MKYLVLLFVLALAGLLMPTPLLAQFQVPQQQQPGQAAGSPRWGVSAEIPLTLVLTGGDDYTATQVGGYSVSAVSPWYVGIGMDRFSVNLEVTSGGSTESTTSTYGFTNIIADIPMEALHLGISYGSGSVTTETVDFGGGAETEIEDASATKHGFHFGIPVGDRIDFQVSYHNIIAAPANFTHEDSMGNRTSGDAQIHSGYALTGGVRANF